MTIKECIDIVDNLKPNQYSPKIKVMWLSFIDEIIINDVLKTHEGYDGRYDNFTGYSEDKLSVPLIVESPYDRLYTAYLKMKIDAENGETTRYNNSVALFNSYMMEYRKFYNKNHLPLTDTKKGIITPINKNTSGISEAMIENLKREIYAQLSEDLLKLVSSDKLYDIVSNYVYNNIEMLKENRNVDLAIEKAFAQLNKIATATLYADNWVGGEEFYSQVVDIKGIPTDYTGTVRLTPAQVKAFHKKDVAFMVGNENGIITVYLIGQKLMNDYIVDIKFEKEERI